MSLIAIDLKCSVYNPSIIGAENTNIERLGCGLGTLSLLCIVADRWIDHNYTSGFGLVDISIAYFFVSLVFVFRYYNEISHLLKPPRRRFCLAARRLQQ
jgi:hypothetical protein